MSPLTRSRARSQLACVGGVGDAAEQAGHQGRAGLRLLNAQIKTCDKRIDQLLDTHPDAPIFLSFPGIDAVVAST